MKKIGSSASLSDLVRSLTGAARLAGEVLKRHFLRARVVSMKGPVSIVTEADAEADRKIIRFLKSRYPDHRFLTEESVPRETSSLYRWIIDPLDGTTNYAHGLPQACVSIGVEKNGRILAGGILDPFKNEFFLAVRGQGATLNGRRIRVSRTKRLIESLLVTGFPYDRQKMARYYLAFNERFMSRTQGIRRMGAAALDLAYVACGRFDGFWEFKLQPWDVAAGWLLVEEAGGRVSDFRGRRYQLSDTRQTLASNGHLHEAMTKILNKA